MGGCIDPYPRSIGYGPGYGPGYAPGYRGGIIGGPVIVSPGIGHHHGGFGGPRHIGFGGHHGGFGGHHGGHHGRRC